MDEEGSRSINMQTKVPMSDEMMNLRKTIMNFVSYKYFFISTLILALALAYIYNTYTIPVYRVSASLLIEEDKKSSSKGNDQLLEGFGLLPGMKNLDNQIMVLSSRSLISKTLDELPPDGEYYYKGLKNKKSIYPAKPLNIIYAPGTQLPRDVEFAFKYMGNGMYRLDAETNGSFEIHKTASFGERIEFTGGNFRIELNESEWFTERKRSKLYFVFPSRRKLVSDYIRRLKVEPVSKKGSIVRISITGTNKSEDLTFLKKYTETFLNISLDKKNSEAVRIIQFIDAQLTGISDSLILTENKLQQFRSKNRVMNLSAQGQVIIDQAMSLENEKARLGLEANYYNYLTEYLEKDEIGEVPIAPATMGIADPGLTKLVADLADLQGRLYNKSMGDKNPLQSQLEQKVLNTKEALKETLRGMSRANDLAIMENQSQINAINAQASALPKTEKELLGIERKHKINDQLYTFLLEKRALALMQKASNIADNELIDYPEYENNPVKPNKPLNYLIALLAGIGFPFLWIFFGEIFNVRVKGLDDIMKITHIPIAGHIPRGPIKLNSIVLEEPESIVTEAFRLLRSRLGFFTKEVKAPVILITSSMSEEGKTFSSINLSSAFSLMDKKTVLIDFDLRKPKIYSIFKLDNKRGVSTWLIGKDKLEDIIQKSNHDNLDIITSGPIPPNPAELTSLKKTDELLKLLKTKYDCIVIDSAPVGTVSDTLHLASLADTCIMVVRQNITYIDLLDITLKDLKISNIVNLCLVLNGTNLDNKYYGYGEWYRYSYKNEKSKTYRGKRRGQNLKSYIFNRIRFR